MDWLEAVKEDLRKAKIVKIGKYDYIVNPLSSGTPRIRPVVLWGCAFEIARVANLKDANVILAPEAMAIHLATALSLITGIPFIVIRKRSYGLKDEIKIVKRTAYAETKMYLYGVKPGDRVILIDSIIATGGTFSAIIKALKERGIIIQDVIAVIEKADLGGVERVEKETGHRVKTLIKVSIENGRVKVI
ncbi:adenine phosphoribosyltransferase [Candidatus Geothermarchaeota archaeon]|nr:MAG: adenine phosphoribosyltransferase [Candidatus Geothermarchaeota archaeon]